MTTIKVFRMNDYEWWAGRSVEEVTAAYLAQSNPPDDEYEELEVRELTDEQMDGLNFLRDPALGEPASVTFREELRDMVERGAEFPCFFATTEI